MNIAPAQRLNSIKEYYFSKKLKEIAGRIKIGEPILNLAIGSPDLPPHPKVLKELGKRTLDPNVHGYQSYRGIGELRVAFTNWYQRMYKIELDPEREILPLMGSKEGIMHISMAFLNPGDKVLIPNPGYPTYKAASEIAGGQTIAYRFRGDKPGWPDLESIPKKELEKTKIIWINYPQMPTGQTASRELFEALVAFAKTHNILICHDNPYNQLLNKKPLSIFSVPGAREVAIELNSLSKTFNMAGWRIGAMIARPGFLETILRFKTNMDSGMFKPLQMAGAVALGLPHKKWMKKLNKTYKKRQKTALKLMHQLNCDVALPQSGLFLWGKIPGNYENAEVLSEKILNEASVFIAPGHVFGSEGDRYLRVSLCADRKKLKAARLRIKNLDLS